MLVQGRMELVVCCPMHLTACAGQSKHRDGQLNGARLAQCRMLNQPISHFELADIVEHKLVEDEQARHALWLQKRELVRSKQAHLQEGRGRGEEGLELLHCAQRLSRVKKSGGHGEGSINQQGKSGLLETRVEIRSGDVKLLGRKAAEKKRRGLREGGGEGDNVRGRRWGLAQ